MRGQEGGKAGNVQGKLVIFDVDGTLVDSQELIAAAMSTAFRAAGLRSPARQRVLGIVGLSLPQAMDALQPGLAPDENTALVRHYKDAFLALRRTTGGEAGAPLYDGAAAAVARLHGAGFTLGIATGKARAGLAHFLGAHRLGGYFSATRTADDAPSKPHPRMVLDCLGETGIEAADAVIVGDTEFDMAMGRAAGIRRIGVGWGYHDRTRLLRGGAEAIAEDFTEIDGLIGGFWGRP